MQIISKLINIPNLSVVLGFFDGVHLAHQKLIKNAVDFAYKNGTKSAVITLKQQPYCFLNNIEPKYILSRQESYKIIESLGIDFLIELDFNGVLSMTSDEYLKNVLVKKFSPVAIFTGFNHHFGLNREGNCEFLAANQNKYGYKFFELPSQTLNGNLISSSAIRESLVNGGIEKANAMLGHNFCVSGKVIEGNKIGRTINFSTANMNYPDNMVEIPNGVYVVNVSLQDNRILKGISNFGTKPTINNTSVKTLETHILNGFNEDIYGQEIKVDFEKFIRKEQKFKDLKELKQQIIKDITCIQE